MQHYPVPGGYTDGSFTDIYPSIPVVQNWGYISIVRGVFLYSPSLFVIRHAQQVGSIRCHSGILSSVLCISSPMRLRFIYGYSIPQYFLTVNLVFSFLKKTALSTNCNDAYCANGIKLQM